MKTLALILMMFAGCAAIASAEEKPLPRLAFEREDAVWVANLDGSGQRKISRGQSPDLSPNGALLAFNTLQAEGKPADRKIAVADLATGKVTVFDGIPSGNAMGVVWSPDGTKLLLTFYNKANEMRIGIVNADGSGFRDLLAGKEYHSYWAPTWAADGGSIFCEDMENLYRLGLDGAVLKQWVIAKLILHGGMSGDERMHASRDGKTLLLDVEMAEKERKGWDGPPAAIWTMDLATEKVTRLTPKTLYGWDCHWLDAGDILFTSQAAGENEYSVWRMPLTGKGRKLLVKNARLASAGG